MTHGGTITISVFLSSSTTAGGASASILECVWAVLPTGPAPAVVESGKCRHQKRFFRKRTRIKVWVFLRLAGLYLTSHKGKRINRGRYQQHRMTYRDSLIRVVGEAQLKQLHATEGNSLGQCKGHVTEEVVTAAYANIAAARRT